MVRARYKAPELLALASGAWLLPVFLLAAVLVGLTAWRQAPPSPAALIAWLILSLGLLVLSGLHIWRDGRLDSTGSILGLLAILLLLISLRLAFVEHVPLPLYVDSAAHYGIIRVLADGSSRTAPPGALALPPFMYYHIGYHIVLAAVATVSQAPLAGLMLVSGQLVLAAVPIPFFLIVHRETGSTVSGIFAVVLAGLGWYMPAHAINWGKYPALFSLPAILTTINLAYLAGEPALDPHSRRKLVSLAVLAGCVAFFVHTRALLVLAVICTAWALAAWWCRQRRLPQSILLTLVILVLTGEGMGLAADPALAQVLDPYLQSGIWITILVGLLSGFAFRAYPRLAFASLLTVALLFLTLFLPVPALVSGTLLDRPMVEMLLFIPLAVVGGAGFAGMLQHFRALDHRLGRAAGAFITLAIVVHALTHYSPYPSTCCSVVTPSDLVALDWIETNVPRAARIAIPSTQVRVASSRYTPAQGATDAGVWILPLTGRQTSDLAYWTDFTQVDALLVLCERGVTNVYVGSVSERFSVELLGKRPEWYKAELLLPGAAIFAVTGCGS
jgi:hypothetical protein